MPDTLDETGLTIKSLTELVTELTDDMKGIYGDDINVEPDTPDGQQINIVAQLGIDQREVLGDINSGFDPDQAQGRVLDQRVAINGIFRQGATFTQTPISITVDRAVTLQGLDDASEDIDIPSGTYTVKDDVGNQFCLLETEAIAAVGTYVLTFRAKDIGNVEVSVNTITTAVTAIAGVTAINNPSSPTVQGRDEETDASLRLRRRKSTAIVSTGYLDSIESALLALDGVTTAIVNSNDTDTTDSEGTPPHTVWAIVEGGDPDEIGATIYAKKSAGSGLRGDVEVIVPRPNGRTYTARFDRPDNQNLWIRFAIIVVGGGVVDDDELKRLIVENVLWGVGESASADTIVCYLKTVNTNYRITGMELSDDNATWDEVIDTTDSASRFVNDIARIAIS
jgi:uncharacterized phage protein gp47/JayE